MASSGSVAFDTLVTFIAKRSDGGVVTRPTKVYDQRGTAAELPSPTDITEMLLNGPGFALVPSVSAVVDFADNEEVRSVYYAEVLTLAQQLLPTASFLPLNHHIYRNEQILAHDFSDPEGALGPPALGVHNDFADDMSKDGAAVVRRYPQVVGMAVPEGQRLVICQVWRSVSEQPLARMPLVVCDRTSIDPDDLRYVRPYCSITLDVASPLCAVILFYSAPHSPRARIRQQELYSKRLDASCGSPPHRFR